MSSHATKDQPELRWQERAVIGVPLLLFLLFALVVVIGNGCQHSTYDIRVEVDGAIGPALAGEAPGTSEMPQGDDLLSRESRQTGAQNVSVYISGLTATNEKPVEVSPARELSPGRSAEVGRGASTAVGPAAESGAAGMENGRRKTGGRTTEDGKTAVEDEAAGENGGGG